MDKFVNQLNHFFHVSIDLPSPSIIFLGSIVSTILGFFLILFGTFRKIELLICFGVAVILSNLWEMKGQK